MKHPEQQIDELYLGNTLPENQHYYGWTSKRLGDVAYDVDGNDISYTGYKPIFIKRSEIESALSAITDDMLNANERRDIFKKMLEE